MRSFPARAPFALLALALPAAAQGYDPQVVEYTFDGLAPGDEFGIAEHSVASVGDIDGDGLSDLLVGARSYDAVVSNGGAARIYSGLDGEVLRTHVGPTVGESVGLSVDGVGDLDGDGLDDYIVGSNYPFTGTVYSGADGSVLHQVADAALTFGETVAGVGDVSGDGVPDFAVGYSTTSLSFVSAVNVYSGADGSLLHAFTEPNASDFGMSIVGVGDVNQDGFGDFAIGAPEAKKGGLQKVGFVDVYSGHDGSLIRRHEGSLPRQRFGQSLACPGDLDLDGTPDLLIGAPGTATVVSAAALVVVYSGQTGDELLAVVTNLERSEFGFSVDGLGDVDADGVPDFVVGAPGETFGRVRVVSGKTGNFLSIVRPPMNTARDFGRSVAGLPDANGDGVPDFASGFREPSGDNHVVVHSSQTLPLAADRHLVPLGAGGTLTLSLDAGPASAGSLYIVLGSASGIAPGVVVGAVTVPLVPDPFFQLTLTKPGLAIFGGYLGTLDVDGRATATLTIPAGSDPTLVGLTLHSAYVAAAVPGIPDLASNAVPLRLRP